MGKDTTIGHWEIAGVVSPKPLPTFPEGFPDALIQEFEEKTGHKVLCNKPLFRHPGAERLRRTGHDRWPPTRSWCRCTSSTVTARSPVRC